MTPLELDIEKRQYYLDLTKLCAIGYKSVINQHQYNIYGHPLIEQRIVHDKIGRGFCRIFWNDADLVISFRGTRGDFDWIHINRKLYPKLLHRHNQLSEQKIYVHRGFQYRLYEIDKTTKLPAFEAALKHIKENNLELKRITITGHSLGGALAILFASKITEWARAHNYSGCSINEVVTLGSPSVGFLNFYHHYNDLEIPTVRIINESDITTLVPPKPYRHVGQQFWLHHTRLYQHSCDARLWKNQFSTRFKNSLSDHNLSEYLHSLENLYTSQQ